MKKNKSTISNTMRLTATAAIAVTGLAAGATAADQIVIDGRPLNVRQLIAQNPNDDINNGQRIHVLKYGGPTSFDRIPMRLSYDEITLRVREIAAEKFGTHINNITDTTVMDLFDDDCIRWRDVIRESMNEFFASYDDEIYNTIDRLAQKDNPTLGDFVKIVDELYDEKARKR